MARIVVETDDRRHTLLDEREVSGVQLKSKHSAEQLLERLAWAIDDADTRIARLDRKTRAARGRRVIPDTTSAVGRGFD